jgi:hypothetical protein
VPRLCEVYPGICLTTEEKARKNLSQGSRRMQLEVNCASQMLILLCRLSVACYFPTFCLSLSVTSLRSVYRCLYLLFPSILYCLPVLLSTTLHHVTVSAVAAVCGSMFVTCTVVWRPEGSCEILFVSLSSDCPKCAAFLFSSVFCHLLWRAFLSVSLLQTVMRLLACVT